MTGEFRIWDKRHNRYFEPIFESYAGEIEEILINQSGQIVLRSMHHFRSEMIGDSLLKDSFDNPEWYTGLKDKNGTKIFEGDILVQARSGYDKYAPANFKFKSVVKWGNRSAQFNVENVWTDKQNPYKAGKKQKFSINPNCEVIGNIHDTEAQP